MVYKFGKGQSKVSVSKIFLSKEYYNRRKTIKNQALKLITILLGTRLTETIKNTHRIFSLTAKTLILTNFVNLIVKTFQLREKSS